MNKQFEHFLKNKPEKSQGCDHDETIWCQHCINRGVRVDWREKGLGQGTIFTN